MLVFAVCADLFTLYRSRQASEIRQKIWFVRFLRVDEHRCDTRSAKTAATLARFKLQILAP